jgi:hypothetical protein
MAKVNFKLRNVAIILACLAAVTSAQAQNANSKIKVSYSGTHYRSNGKLYSKDWVSVDGGNLRARNESIDEQTGETRIFIYRQDSAKFYLLNPENKKAMVLPMSQIKGGINSLVGLDVEKSETKKLELLGTDIIEGFECKHYLSTSISTMKNGTENAGCFEYWLYEPLGVQMQHKEGCGYTPVITLKNFKQGPQPDALFEIPKGYQMTELPVGGLMEMFTGKSRAENQKDADQFEQDAKKATDELGKKFEDLQKNSEGKSEAEKIQDALQMLEGLNSKKK